MAAGPDLTLPVVAGVGHRDVEAAGVRFHVAEAGSGPPLVLVHGWPQNWWIWRRVLPLLAERHRVICPDLRGFGWSDAPPGDYAKETLAADLIALLDALDLDRVSLVGHDWGGFASFLACLKAPERFDRLVALNIVHPWMKLPRPTPAALLRVSYQYVLATPFVGPMVLRSPVPFIKTILRKGSHPDTRWSDEELDTYANLLRRPAHARASSALYRTFLTKELRPITRGRYADERLRVPTLLLTGEADPVVTLERLGGYEQHADDMQLGVIAGAGHFTPEEQPQELAARILG